MESQQHAEARGDTDTAASIRCDVQTCGEPAAVDFETHPLCPTHFFSESLRELDARVEEWRGLAFEQSATDQLRTFLNVCETQAKTLEEKEPREDAPAKVRAREVLRRVSQVGQKMRRSPRFAASVPVWLRREDPGKTWEEQTWTSSVSRYGARFSCNRGVDVGGEVVLCRRDKGNRVRARVVYCRYDEDGRREIGVELLDPDDFWELEKRMNPPPAQEPRTAENVT